MTTLHSTSICTRHDDALTLRYGIQRNITTVQSAKPNNALLWGVAMRVPKLLYIYIYPYCYCPLGIIVSVRFGRISLNDLITINITPYAFMKPVSSTEKQTPYTHPEYETFNIIKTETITITIFFQASALVREAHLPLRNSAIM